MKKAQVIRGLPYRYLIIISAILITVVVIICLVLVSINNKHRQKAADELISRFHKLAEENSLNLSDRELLENFIISMDREHLKVLFFKRQGDIYDSLIIDLKEVKNCSKEKIYKSVNMGTGKKEMLETHVDKIVLEFNFIDKREPVQISFYESERDHSLEMRDLEEKAMDWEAMLTKTINKELKKTA